MAGNEIKLKKTAEQYACESLARNQKTWIVYDRKTELDEWLDTYVPSKVFQSDDVGWISMGCGSSEAEENTTEDYDNLDVEWEALKSSGNPVNYYSICEIARNNSMLPGQWMAHIDSDIKVDILWKKIAKQYFSGVLTGVAVSCKVTHYDSEPGRGGSYIIFVGNRDFSNREEVYELEEAIRDAGIKSRLLYKPVVYTHLGIYRNNEFNIRPSIYISEHDILKKKSVLTALYEAVNAANTKKPEILIAE